MATPTVDEILEKARKKPHDPGIQPITCTVDGEPIGKQVGRIQRSITNIAAGWERSKKEYETLAKEMFEDFLKHSLKAMKFVPRNTIKKKNGESNGRS